jgi:CheY-like chemotaxis protein
MITRSTRRPSTPATTSTEASARRSAAPPRPEPPALTETAISPQPSSRRLRILVIEDNRDAADSLRILLELMGHDVKVAYSGPDGVATAAAWAPEVIVCDIGLPGLDGYGVARAIRQAPATAHACLIALTGYGSDEDRRRAHEAGFDFHLVKPAPPEVLEELLGASSN